MKKALHSRSRVVQLFLKVVVIFFFPLPFFMATIQGEPHIPVIWRMGIACASSLTAVICGFTLFRWPRAGKITGAFSLTGLFVISLPFIEKNPFSALLSIVTLIFMGFVLLDFNAHEYTDTRPAQSNRFRGRTHWFEVFLTPARMLLTTFLGLCSLGTMLLLLPVSMASDPISFIDAAFTSVSAVCVTGLAVLDTPTDFSMTGQVFILILIQFGGLGIMGITTVALHAMGKRLSLKGERLIISMTDTDYGDMVASLALILKFTFMVEGLGAVILAGGFHALGEDMLHALWRGIFTAVSAFCNAGFALQSDSLTVYQDAPLILYMVGILIVLGGLAPATSIMIPQWIRGRHIPVPARIDLVATLVLLISGTFFILIFEWNGFLFPLSFFDKFHNAWFQSATLRTAGFNSVDISTMTGPTFLVMLFLMFIGGCPGGTAGGIKATTVSILAMTFWSNLIHSDRVTIHNRNISSHTIFRAITVVVSGLCVWFVMVLMLEVTQGIPSRELLFEVTSAMATVGLSTGATAHLDEVGKVIVILAMFIGRIGPVTLFMLLRQDYPPSVSRCPDVKITLT